MTGTGVDLGKSYVSFVRNNMDNIAKRITDDLWVLNIMEVCKDLAFFSDKFSIFQKWYFDQVQMLSTWLTDRLDKSLHPFQCTCLAHVVKVSLC